MPEYGGPDVLRVVDLPAPVPAAGEVLVRVQAAAVQIADVAVREGQLADVMPDPALPMTLGWEVAGTVEAAGPGAHRFAAAYPVIGLSRHFLTGVGTQAELVALPEANLSRAPRSVDAVAASTLPIALTAVQALDPTRRRPRDQPARHRRRRHRPRVCPAARPAAWRDGHRQRQPRRCLPRARPRRHPRR